MAPELLEEENLSSNSENTAISENTVAAVDGVEILTKEELDEKLIDIVERFEATGRETTPRWRNQRRRRIVLEAVHAHVLERYIETQDIEVTDQEVEDAIRTELTYRFDDEQLFERFLNGQNTTREEYFQQRRHDLIEEQILAERGSLDPTEEELQAFYQQHRERWQEGDRAHVSEITIRLRSDASDERVEEKLQRITAARDRITNGESFADVAREVSESGNNIRGGDEGWIVRGRRAQLARDGVEELIFSAELRVVTDPVRTQLGWQLFLIHDRRDAGIRDIDEVRSIIYRPIAQRMQTQLRLALVNELLQDKEVQHFEDQWGLEEEIN